MLDAAKETWLLAIEGHAQLGPTTMSPGDAVFLEADHAEIEAGEGGLKALLAYPGPSANPDALRERISAGTNRTHSLSCAPVEPISLEHAGRTQPETRTWRP